MMLWILDRSYETFISITTVVVLATLNGCAEQPQRGELTHGGFEEFLEGQFDNGGGNLYVNAHGVIETIHRWDVNHDGYTDIIFVNSEAHSERGPTRVFQVEPGQERGWQYRDLSGQSGYHSTIVDLDQDGFGDVVVANADSGISGELSSFVYWGDSQEPGKERTDLPTIGAYDVAVLDIDRDGLLDLIFPSSWKDRHNSAEPIPAHVFLAAGDRKFRDATLQYNITCIGTKGIGAEDLNGDGIVDLVLANSRHKYDRDTDSFVYWGRESGVAVENPVRLPTHGAENVLLADLNQDGTSDIVFSGGGEALIYWNRQGEFAVHDNLLLRPQEDENTQEQHIGTAVFTRRKLAHCTAADVDRDGINDLIVATATGVEIRSGGNIQEVSDFLPLENLSRVTVGDLNSDALPDLVVSRSHDGTTADTESAIFWASQDGFSTERASWVPTGNPVGNAIGDVNGDGKPEVVVNNCGGGRITGISSFIYLGNEEGTYSGQRRLELPRHEAYESCMVDLNLDGYTDVVLTGCDYFNSRIFYGGPDGPSPTEYVDLENVNNTVVCMEVGDINRDGYLDILTNGLVYDSRPETLNKSSTIFFGSPDGFSSSRVQRVPSYGFGIHLADLDRDGYLEAIFSDKRDFLLVYVGSKEGISPQRTYKIPCPIPSRLNSADLNGDGWLDLIVSHSSHALRRQESFTILYSQLGKYSPAHSQTSLRGISVSDTAVADFNGDGHLDVMASAYSSPTARVLPATLYWGDGQRIDMERPLLLPASSSAGLAALDFNRDGWIDIAIANHRDDASHQVDSFLYWNSPDGFNVERMSRLPTHGPHGTTCRDFGNGYTRQPEESYLSPPLKLGTAIPDRIHWDADVSAPAQLRFQLRWALSQKQLQEADWVGHAGMDSYYDRSGQAIDDTAVGRAGWLQYKATFTSPYGCKSPKLKRVRFGLTGA